MLAKRLLELSSEYQDALTSQTWQTGAPDRSLDDIAADYEMALAEFVAGQARSDK